MRHEGRVPATLCGSACVIAPATPCTQAATPCTQAAAPRVQAAALLCVQVYDKKEDGGPRFVFHTAFTDPASPPDAPPRKSIEVRAIAFYDPPPLAPEELATRAAPGDSTGAARPHTDPR